MFRDCIRLPMTGIILITMLFGTAVTADTSSGGSLTPAFSINSSSGPAPLAVRFIDMSNGSNITGWAWDFNDDGITDSTDENPECIYLQPGNYSVSHTVTGSSGSKTTSHTNAITVRNPVPAASFTADNVSGSPPLEVRFRDTSTGPNITGWAWDFNDDGITDSTDENPECFFLQTGNYTVSHTVITAFGPVTTTRPGIITVTNGAVPAFAANQTSGVAPLAVRFSDRSTGSNITGWAWDFDNDGITDSNDENPECVYLLAGSYTISLTVSTAFGQETTTRPGLISVTTGAVPAFTANQTRGTVPFTVRFSDQSTGPNITGRAWDFNNDGITDSTDENPECVYLLPDRYTVNLTLTNAGGANTTSMQDFIVAGSLAPVAGFTTNSTTGLAPLAVQFTDTSAGMNITGWAWDFNDDGITDSSDPDPVCVYNLPDEYTVRLRVTNEHGSNTTIRRDSVSVSNGLPVAKFAVNRSSGPAPLAVRFRDMSTGPDIAVWAWDFDSDGIIDNTDKDAVNTYPLPGNYTVELNVTNAWGSDRVVRKNFIQVI